MLTNGGARRDLDDLLVAALDRTIALAKVDDVAVIIADDLKLDVARLDDEFFHKNFIVVKKGLRLPRARVVGALHILLVPHFADTASAAAAASL